MNGWDSDQDPGVYRCVVGLLRMMACNYWACEVVVWNACSESVEPIVAGGSVHWPSMATNRTTVASDVRMVRRCFAWRSVLSLG